MPALFNDEFWAFITPVGYADIAAALQDLYVDRNLGVPAVSRILGCSAGPIYRKLRELGVPIKGHGGYRHGRRSQENEAAGNHR